MGDDVPAASLAALELRIANLLKASELVASASGPRESLDSARSFFAEAMELMSRYSATAAAQVEADARGG